MTVSFADRGEIEGNGPPRARAVRYSGYFVSTAVLPFIQPGLVPVGVTIFTGRFGTDGGLPSGVMISRPKLSFILRDPLLGLRASAVPASAELKAFGHLDNW